MAEAATAWVAVHLDVRYREAVRRTVGTVQVAAGTVEPAEEGRHIADLVGPPELVHRVEVQALVGPARGPVRHWQVVAAAAGIVAAMAVAAVAVAVVVAEVGSVAQESLGKPAESIRTK